MAIDYAQLKIDDAAGHPDTGAFSASAATAVNEWNAQNRPNTALSAGDALKFLLLDNTYKSDDGADTQDRSLWQRLKEVVSLETVPSQAMANPWGSVSIGNITEIQQVKVHQLYDFFLTSAQGNLQIDLTDSNFKVYLAGAEACGCMSAVQETAFLDLRQISYAQERGYGVLKEGDIAYARSLT